jgi:hypothetical protein
MGHNFRRNNIFKKSICVICQQPMRSVFNPVCAFLSFAVCPTKKLMIRAVVGLFLTRVMTGSKLKDRQKTMTAVVNDRTDFNKDRPVQIQKTSVFLAAIIQDGRRRCTCFSVGTSRCHCGPRVGKVQLCAGLQWDCV